MPPTVYEPSTTPPSSTISVSATSYALGANSGHRICAPEDLNIDMNIAEPEVYALAYFRELLTPGGIIIFDDYASMAHVAQKRALDAMAAKLDAAILALPTGQGMLIKA